MKKCERKEIDQILLDAAAIEQAKKRAKALLKYHPKQADCIEYKKRAVQNNKIDSSALETERETNSRANEEQGGGIKVHNTENCAGYIDKCGEVGRVEVIGGI